MKTLILIAFMFLVAGFARGESLKMGEFDQAHLANLLNALPEDQVEREVTSITQPREGEKVTLTFAPHESGLSINCWQTFFPPSPWASYGGCQMKLDLKSPSVKQQNDEVRIILDDPIVAAALFETIPYGKPLKRFYSFDKLEGITFDGVFDNLFTYRFTCSSEKCEVDLAAENLRPDK